MYVSVCIMCMSRASGTGDTGGCRAELSLQPLIIFICVCMECFQVTREDRRGYWIPR